MPADNRAILIVEDDPDMIMAMRPVQGFFDKPVDPDQLLHRIEEILGRGR